MGNGIFRNTFICDVLDYGICWSGKNFLQQIEPKIATCELTKSSFMGLNKGELTSSEQVEGARFETRDITDSDGKSMTVYNVFLPTKDEKIFLANDSAEDASSFNE